MESDVKDHYNSDHLTQRIEKAIIAARKDPLNIGIKDLSGIDQLHTGGAKASLDLLKQVSFPKKARLLDAGCGIGGSSRLFATHLNCKVDGIDLADQFINAARFLTRATHLENQIKFHHGSVLNLPFERNTFDGVLCQHILMNIEDKSGAIKEFHRVLKPGGKLILHEITKGKNNKLRYPVPWAAKESISFLKPWGVLSNMLSRQGFSPLVVTDKSQDALAWNEKVRVFSLKKSRPANPLNAGLIFGSNAMSFGENMVFNFGHQIIHLFEAVYKKRLND